jgi:hypothetical protein
MPKFMTDNQPTTTKNFMQRNPWIIIPAILIMGSVFVYNIVDLNAKTEPQKWEKSDYNAMVRKCITNCGDLGVKYQNVTEEYCECATKKIQQTFSKDEYLEILKKEPSEGMKITTPVIQDCMGEYQDTINVLINK